MVELSLIVCTYRRHAELERLLRSVIVQTKSPDEILIVDASEDDLTREICEKMQTDGSISNLVYYKVGDSDRGLTRQRNFGVRRSHGKTIAFLDDDIILDRDYFAEVLGCFRRNPLAVGVGGYITEGHEWSRTPVEGKTSVLKFRQGDWERREDIKYVVRKLFRLDSRTPPGWFSESGHARSLGCIPPDGNDHQVQFLMGGASAWRRGIFEKVSFSEYFEGYGLYEDLDFTLRASLFGPLILCTRAFMEHHHAPSGRPRQFRYGVMVVRNGWFVWRRRWNAPGFKDRLRWWATTGMLALLRLLDIRPKTVGKALPEAFGRFVGMLSVLISQPK